MDETLLNCQSGEPHGAATCTHAQDVSVKCPGIEYNVKYSLSSNECFIFCKIPMNVRLILVMMMQHAITQLEVSSVNVAKGMKETDLIAPVSKA